MKRGAKIGIAVVVAGVVVVLGGGYGHHLFTQWQNTQDKLPAFSEIPPGNRAPKDSSMFGIDVGRSSLTDVEAWQKARSIACNNTSMRALMEQTRQETQKKMAEAKQKGEDPDGVTGASLANYHSKKERNPQVRLACEDVDGSQLQDRPRAGEHGRLLVVFDSEKLPVRYVAFDRYIQDPAAAFASYQAALQVMTARYGKVTTAIGDEPDPADEKPALARREWRFTDLRAELQLMGHGGRGVEVRELLEVPWPVRPDAPGLP